MREQNKLSASKSPIRSGIPSRSGLNRSHPTRHSQITGGGAHVGGPTRSQSAGRGGGNAVANPRRLRQPSRFSRGAFRGAAASAAAVQSKSPEEPQQLGQAGKLSATSSQLAERRLVAASAAENDKLKQLETQHQHEMRTIREALQRVARVAESCDQRAPTMASERAESAGQAAIISDLG